MSTAAPVFIVAAPFSGASGLAATLGVHPQLCVIPETGLFCADDVDALLEIFEISQGANADGLLRALAELEFGAQTDANVAAAWQWLQERPQWPTAHVLAYLADRAAPRRLVVPETDAVLRVADLQRLQQGFPDAEILQLVRHPWTQAAQLARWLDGCLFVAPDFRDFSSMPAVIDPQIAWLRINRNLESLLRPAYGSRWHCLRIEAFEHPSSREAALASLCAALGLEAFAPDCDQRQSTWAFTGYGPPAAPYGFGAELLETLPPLPVDWGAERLEGPLPWRRDGHMFADEVLASARAYGYR